MPPTTYVPVSLYSTTLNSTPCQSACILLRAFSSAASLLAAALTTCSLGSCSSRSNCSRCRMLKGAKPAFHETHQDQNIPSAPVTLPMAQTPEDCMQGRNPDVVTTQHT